MLQVHRYNKMKEDASGPIKGMGHRSNVIRGSRKRAQNKSRNARYFLNVLNIGSMTLDGSREGMVFPVTAIISNAMGKYIKLNNKRNIIAKGDGAP